VLSSWRADPRAVVRAGATAAAGFASFARGAKFEALLADPATANAKLNLFWYACGDKDAAFPRARELSGLLKKSRIEHTVRVVADGLHTWPVWRLCLSEFAPLLFH
jgi:enterochelin esterase-like enzyme